MNLRILGWEKYFENASSRKLKRLDWVAIPNKTDGEGYTALVDHPNGAAHLGAWYAIVEVASKQDPRGRLPGGISRDLGGICRSLGRMSRLPASVFEEVIPRLLEIGWLEDTEPNQSLAPILAESADALADSPNVLADSPTHITGNYRELQGTTENPPKPPAAKTAADSQTPIPFLIDKAGTQAPSRREMPLSTRFEDWWHIWSSVRGTNHRPQAENAYFRLVNVSNEKACFDCTESYLSGLKDSHGYNPENFLEDQSRDGFAARWPKAREPTDSVRLTPTQIAIQMVRDREAKKHASQ
jgi:hypothetical protein